MRPNTTASIVAGVLLLVFLLVGGALLGRGVLNNNSTDDKKEEEKYATNGTVVYGYWKGENSVIDAVDLSTGKNNTLALLPSAVKHIRILNGNEFIYIGETDQYDYGKKLILHTIDPPSDVTIMEVEDGFGIDDYVVSPNGSFASVWVVGVPSTNTQSIGNQSKVYSLDINSKISNLIYDEVSSVSNPVHYPLGITNNGDIFLDRFLPNSGVGWAYGMSKSDFSGQNKEDIESMKNGTYGTQPIMSPDGAYFAFAGYDGKDGATSENTYRKAVVSPNTVEILSVKDLSRKKVDTKISNAIYSYLVWDQISGKLFVSATQKINNSVGRLQYSYNVAEDKFVEIPNPNPSDFVISSLANDATLFGEYFTDREGLGNLGPSYGSSYSKLVILNPATSESNYVSLDQQPVQLIAVRDSGYFPSVREGKDILADASKQLQLQTFEFKPTLAPVREQRQSYPQTPETPTTGDPPPACRTVTYPQCNELLGTDYPVGTDIGDLNDDAFSECVWAQQTAGEAKSSCSDSPLYLYGEKGQSINVSVATEISNPNITFDNNTFRAILDGKGNIQVDDKKVSSISFDYLSRVKKLSRPEYGYVVKNENVTKKLQEVAVGFGFNTKETTDLISYGSKINSPYVFISWYDDKTSKEILPIFFDPKPDNYRNIVFYFEKRREEDEKFPKKPTFERINRTGFTAVEISFILK